MCNACIPTLNTAQTTDAFADRLVDMLNQGALSLMVSIGHRTGLFDTLAELPPSTSTEIADHSGLDERYVREWLGALVTGGIVQYRPDDGRYQLPASHAAVLTRAASPDNIAVFAQYIGLLGSVEDRVIDCFRNGGGVGYEHYPRFHAVMAEDSGQTVLSALDEHVLPLVQHLIPRLEQGIRVLDVGCGRARVITRLAARFPRSEFVGLDLSDEALASAREEAARQGLSNIRFQQQDLTHFNRDAEPQGYDWVTAFDAIHDQAAPQNVLDGIHRTLKPGGTFLMQDINASSRLENNIAHPIGPLLYTISTLHCMTVSLAQGGAGLGTMWGEELARKMLGVAGFSDIDVHQLDHDFQNSFYVIRKAA
ncbi:class I SAM-dependent methyltransferase [Motiliproteus sp. SC1-56]|uniref:class I SAM-dependent methyltransferase n=1 Tax=Motiliproteus sp. SC1-56 TaxID=2799565 RepID=UPI001A900F02|nr:class I SAM-dependent methyltransferase [Motiliproteus sp. SC1-56]